MVELLIYVTVFAWILLVSQLLLVKGESFRKHLDVTLFVRIDSLALFAISLFGFVYAKMVVLVSEYTGADIFQTTAKQNNRLPRNLSTE